TLIEMSVVVAIIGVLYLTVIPMYGTTVHKSKEAVLKEDLYVIRKVIDQYYKDHQAWPPDLDSLVKSGYLRAIPVDPITNKIDSWTILSSDPWSHDVYDIHSGAQGNGLDGTPYGSW
ncbi:type II secretion system protein G, partial [bacterium]|nr:type II secretion system protein G [bacterium]